MNRILFSAFLAAVLFTSCANRPAKRVQTPAEISPAIETPESYIITDYKNKSSGGKIPEWVTLWLEGGADKVEALDAYQDRYVFVGRNEGNNFNALTQWAEGFSPELDFPRLAASRIEARFSSGVSFPDDVYGAFFEALIRAASDALWTGAVREDDFWILREFPPPGQNPENPDSPPEGPPPARGSWEFLILVTMGKTLFASQFDTVFQSAKPSPLPSKDQIAAAVRVKDRFYEGF